MSIYLGVNVDHVATLREARHTRYPDPLEAVFLAERGGADGITIHLREDRRHIQEHDVWAIQQRLATRLNLEMALTEGMIELAERIKPAWACIVPEKRAELTTEGGLDVIGQEAQIKAMIERLQSAGIQVSLFIDPDEQQIAASKRVQADAVEIHTGCYADATDVVTRERELQRIERAAHDATQQGLIVNAGHGLNYHNVQAIAAISCIHELNIGHAIVARALFSGMEQAVRDMKQLLIQARG